VCASRYRSLCMWESGLEPVFKNDPRTRATVPYESRAGGVPLLVDTFYSTIELFTDMNTAELHCRTLVIRCLSHPSLDVKAEFGRTK